MAEPRLEEPPVAVSPEDIQVTPRRTGRSHVDLIIAVTAIVLSVISLFVAIQNAWTQREMVSASTWPYVTGWIKVGANEHGDIQFGIGNSGVGPAKVRSFEVTYEGQAVSSARDLLRRCCGLPADTKAADAMLAMWTSSTVVNDVVLRAGDDQPAFVLRPNPASPGLAARLSRAVRELHFQTCYCSVLDECWKTAGVAMEPVRVKSCPVSQVAFDAGGP